MKNRHSRLLLTMVAVIFATCVVYGIFRLGMVALDDAEAKGIQSIAGVIQDTVPFQEENFAMVEIQADNSDSEDQPVVSDKSIGISAQQFSADSIQKPELFENYYDAAEKLMTKMTLKEKVGQLFLFHCPDSGAVDGIEEYQPGGYMLMASHFRNKTKDQVKNMIASFQSASKIKMAVAADEEGGTVVRVSGFPALSDKKFQSPQKIFQQGGMNAVYNDTVEKSKLLLSYGINLNLAPVADVSTNSRDFMYDRSFGKDGKETAGYIKLVVCAMNSQKLSSTLKHFPGYGNSGDTHTGIVYDKRDYSQFVNNDFLPFLAGIQEGADCVLVSHNIVNCMDPKNPASLSPKVHQILREELGFTGIIMTDDLNMEAIRDYTDGKNPSVMAFQAGNDMLLCSNMKADFNAVFEAAQNGEITEEEIDQRVRRILAWKYKMGIIN